MLKRSNLHPYQNKAVEFIEGKEGAALFLDCGLGKTVCVLTYLTDLLNSFEAVRVLIVAPKRVCDEVWAQEAVKWQHSQDMTFSKVLGTPAQRIKAIKSTSEVYLVNYENLVWLIENTDFDYDTVVFDEFSKMKSPKAKRFKAFKRIRHKVERVLGLTATPSSAGLRDLWAQLYCLDMGESLGKSFNGFSDRFFESDYMGYKFTPLKGTEQEIKERIQDKCMYMSAEDYLDLPERIDNDIVVPLPKRLKKQYAELSKECILELENNTVVAQSAAALSTKLNQFANGAIYVDDKQTYEEVHSLKLDVLESVIEESAGAPVLVAYSFKSDKERILKRFKNAETLDSKNAVERWNRGEIPILLAHPASAGHGLNIQAGGHIIAWYGLTWSYELYYQFYKRLDRQGQIKTVIQHRIIIEGTVDEVMVEVLEGRCTDQKTILNMLKEKVKSV